jgi:hypothetical protein
MSLRINRPHQAFMNVVVDWAGHVIDALAPIVSIDRPEGYRDSGYCDGEPLFPNDGNGLAGDDTPTLSRTIRWADGRDVTLHWKLPAPGP